MPRPTDAVPKEEVRRMIFLALETQAKSHGWDIPLPEDIKLDTDTNDVERQTRKRLEEIDNANPALAASAIALARLMDSRPTAAVGKELRETVLAIEKGSNVEQKSEKDALKELIAGVQAN